MSKKARFGARRKPEKSTIWCTKKTTKKHDLVHEENQKKARLGARKKNRKKHDLVHEENDKKARTRARFGV